MTEEATGGNYPQGADVRSIPLPENAGRAIIWQDGGDVRVLFQGLPRASVYARLDPTGPVDVTIRIPAGTSQEVGRAIVTASAKAAAHPVQ